MGGELVWTVPCAECGMPCVLDEYHPFAACLMFKACHNSETVRANLIPQSTHQSLLDRVEALAGLLRAAVLMPRRECDNTIVEIETELRRLVADAKNGEPK